MADEILLKWGTLKGWRVESEAYLEALQAYADAGQFSAGAATQHDTDAQKDALCAAIDAVSASGGTIQNDWTGAMMTADEAKQYVREYGQVTPALRLIRTHWREFITGLPVMAACVALFSLVWIVTP